ncbi:methylated-DNA--[protein]-cysteine S-methyltransferase [Polycladidibacter stylochi]|uniref:methylated-DNA--[protein]-cysteine S-methyltransferase n=1 Tax=Polycladidibacter stylochi TaxID=1807766 RepID=UPI00082F6560|nr:bifunctional helix-turn-helix domain-containing protein/methylated-DNA--[protein]-cysteine S-methyltransferase [Pseudovibrio stylochi]
MDKTVTDYSNEHYKTVQTTLQYISENWREQPSLEELSKLVSMQPIQLQRLFSKWAGLTPKQFLQAITIDHARAMLQNASSVFDTTYELGLSGPARLHDLFVTHEAMTPGDYRRRGAGITISYGFHPCPFGLALVMATERGLAGLAFADDNNQAQTLEDMCQRWPAAEFVEDQAATAPYVQRIFNHHQWRAEEPLKLIFIGTDFEIRVWESLLKIPLGAATTYSDIAKNLGKPKASRAVGTAVGKNPISFVVPCHRVLGKSGNLCGYHWGLTRKRAILGWEAGISGVLDMADQGQGSLPLK